MEEKVRQITQKEAKEIDANKVSYYTLRDGTVVVVKRVDEKEGPQIQGGESLKLKEGPFMNSNKNHSNQINEQNTLPIPECQEKDLFPSQIQNQQYLNGNKNENTNQINTNIISEVHGQAKNTNNQQTFHEGKNYGFFLSESKNNTLIQRKEELNPSYIYKIPQTKEELFSVNSKLVDAMPYNFKGQLYPLRNIQNIQQTSQFPQKRQFYKLIEAIPINIGNNAKVNLYQCNHCSSIPK